MVEGPGWYAIIFTHYWEQADLRIEALPSDDSERQKALEYIVRKDDAREKEIASIHIVQANYIASFDMQAIRAKMRLEKEQKEKDAETDLRRKQWEELNKEFGDK